ncbi:hypothetical protein HON58_03290 [Candidatus Peregrinibacteria bacterium]|nr:hypothetical protein [Candidatus Peregrinibacteria bacterium]
MADDNTFNLKDGENPQPQAENTLNTGNGEAPAAEPVAPETPVAAEEPSQPAQPSEIKLDSLATSTPDAIPAEVAPEAPVAEQPAPEATPAEEAPAEQPESAPVEETTENPEDLDKKLEEQLEQVDTSQSTEADKSGQTKLYIMIAVIAFAVVAVGYAGYYFFFSGDSAEIEEETAVEDEIPTMSTPFGSDAEEEAEDLEELDNLVDSLENQLADSEETYEEAVLEEVSNDSIPALTGGNSDSEAEAEIETEVEAEMETDVATEEESLIAR